MAQGPTREAHAVQFMRPVLQKEQGSAWLARLARLGAAAGAAAVAIGRLDWGWVDSFEGVHDC